MPLLGQGAGVDGCGYHRCAEPLHAVPRFSRAPEMYRRILVAVENSARRQDDSRSRRRRVSRRLTGAVAAARALWPTVGRRATSTSSSCASPEEMKIDRDYLGSSCAVSSARVGLTVDTRLAMGDPATELVEGVPGTGRRPDRHVDPRPPLRQGRPARRDRGPGPPPRQDARSCCCARSPEPSPGPEAHAALPCLE